MERKILSVFLLFGLVHLIFSSEPTCYRLSTDVIPSHYSIKIRPYVDEGYFDGEVSIYVRAKRAVDKVTLHSSQLNITHAAINRIEAEIELGEDDKLSLRYADHSIQPGEHVLSFKYQGVLQTSQIGLIKASYDYNEEKGHLVVTDFEPSSARKAFPCFDEPAFKSKFNLRLVAPDETYTVISNTEEINRFTSSHGVVYDFATSLPMSTYLVSFAFSKYPYYEDKLEVNGRTWPIRIHTYNASKSNNEYAMNCTKKALQFYAEYTNISYPLSKLDMIEYNRPESAATENWGLITFREGLLSVHLGVFDEVQIKIVVYHELAHFWFGNLVTNDWWNDLWLQEGFATYMSYKLHLHEVALGETQTARETFFNGYLEVFTMRPNNPVVNYVANQTQLEQRFDSIVYEKGAFVLLMIENVLGEELFQEAIRKFLKRHAYKTATTNDFISAIEEELPHTPIRDFVEGYLYQDRYPLITVKKSAGKFVLEQHVCLATAKYSTSGQKWTLPITYITNNNRTPTLKWFDKEMDNLTIDEPNVEWILFNKKDVALYRVNFSSDVWDTLMDHWDDFSMEESKFLVKEALYSFRFGMVDCSIGFNLMKKVKYNRQWFDFIEFHDIMSTGLTCNGYKKEIDIYRSFLQKKMSETDKPRKPYFHEEDCSDRSDIMKATEKMIDFKWCANWIRENLSANINTISES